MKLSYLAAPAAALLLSGCQFFQEKPPVPAAPAPVLAAVPAQQQALWREGVINTRSALPADVIRAQGQWVAVDWNGDAVELLSHLARQRGQKFAWTGVRLPLPVDIEVDGISYQNLLTLIEMQTAWRATLHQLPGQLTLAFAQSQPLKKAGGRR